MSASDVGRSRPRRVWQPLGWVSVWTTDIRLGSFPSVGSTFSVSTTDGSFPCSAVRWEATGLETRQASGLTWLHRWEQRGDEESVNREDSSLLITPVPFSPPRRALRLIISNPRHS